MEKNNKKLENVQAESIELTDDDLFQINGGNQNVKGKDAKGRDWPCPYCGQIIKIVQAQDAQKHVAHDCPKNPMRT